MSNEAELLKRAKAERLKEGIQNLSRPDNEGFIIVSFFGDEMTFDHSINLFQICHAKLRLEQIYQHLLFNMKQAAEKKSPSPTPHPGTPKVQ